MHAFFSYLRTHRRVLICYFIFVAMFATVFSLYRLPIGAVLYPALLCAAIGIVFCALDYRRQRKKFRALQAARATQALLSEVLPHPGSDIEAAYQALLYDMQRQTLQLQQEAAQKYSDTVAYYTTWAHQIKTPIASMRLYLDAEDCTLSRALAPALFHIEQYVEMVLAYVRLGSKSHDFVFRTYALDEILRASLRRFAGEFIARKLTLSFTPSKQ